jgi:hypothetical protein
MQRDKMLAIHTQEHASRSLFWQVRPNRPKPVAYSSAQRHSYGSPRLSPQPILPNRMPLPFGQESARPSNILAAFNTTGRVGSPQAASATNIRKSGRNFIADKSGSHSIWRNESEPLK